ncbi:hypothetical protein ACOMHN_044972 [Nucella lapillus]
MPRCRPARPTGPRRNSGSRKTSEGPLWPPYLQPGGPRRIYSSMVTPLMQTIDISSTDERNFTKTRRYVIKPWKFASKDLSQDPTVKIPTIDIPTVRSPRSGTRYLNQLYYSQRCSH